MSYIAFHCIIMIHGMMFVVLVYSNRERLIAYIIDFSTTEIKDIRLLIGILSQVLTIPIFP